MLKGHAKGEVRKKNSQESSQANQFQEREYMKVEKLEIDSLKAICAWVSLGKSSTPWGMPAPV